MIDMGESLFFYCPSLGLVLVFSTCMHDFQALSCKDGRQPCGGSLSGAVLLDCSLDHLSLFKRTLMTLLLIE